MQSDKEYTAEVADIIRGISSKYSYKFKDYDLSREDLEQELWVSILEAEKRKGEQLDANLVAKICYDRVKDLISFYMRRSHVPTPGPASDDDEKEPDYIGPSQSESPEELDFNIELKNLYNSFPEGSKERIFIDFWGNATGAFPNNRVVPEKTRKNDGFSEDSLAKILGYSGQSSGGYRKFRNKMRNIISTSLKDYSTSLT